MKAKNTNQELIDRKLEIDHAVNELIANHLNDFEDNGLASVKYIRKEIKRVHKKLKQCSMSGKLS